MDEARTGPGPESGGATEAVHGAAEHEASVNAGIRQQARDAVRSTREQVAARVRDRADSAREEAVRMADEGKRTFSGSVHALASAFDAAAASLSEDAEDRLAGWTRELSSRTHRLASYLDENDTRGLVTDLEGTAREHPAAFLGTTFAAGLAAGRFLRSSERAATDTGVESRVSERPFGYGATGDEGGLR